MTRFRNNFPILIAVFLALIPLLLFAYLGQFSRMMADDYGYLGKALQSGTWEAMLFWRENWNGDYTNFLLYGLLAPMGVIVPSIFPTVILFTGLLGFVWLNLKLLAFLSIRNHRYLIAVALASLVLASAINGFHSGQVYYWFTATLEYTLPALALLLCLAFTEVTARRLRTDLQLKLAAIAVSAIAFLNAGFSEIYLVFQLTFLALLVACVYVFVDRPMRRTYVVLACAGLLGTLASLAVQTTSPGIAVRSILPEIWGYKIEPMRALPVLFARTSELTFQNLGHQRAFAGFMLLAAAGMVTTLKMYRPVPADNKPGPPAVATSALWLGLIVQMICFPVLWTHTSDNIQVLRRFSYPYMAVIVINLAFIIALLALIRQRKLLGKALNTTNGLVVYSSIILLAVCVLFTLTQIRYIHHKAASYLFISSMVLLGMLSWQLTAVLEGRGDRRATRIGLLAFLSSAITVLTFATQIAASLWGQGFVFERTFAPITFLLMVSGLMWGANIGASIRRSCQFTEANAPWFRWAGLLSLLVSLTIGTGISIGQAQRIDDLATRARIQDEVHQEIMRLRDAGNPAVYTQEFVRVLVSHLGTRPSVYTTKRLDWRQRLFYGLDYVPDFS